MSAPDEDRPIPALGPRPITMDQYHAHTPEKFELWDGKLFFDENDRVNLLALLLEQAGVDVAVRLGRLEVWEAAVAACQGVPRELISRRPGGWEEGYEGEYPLEPRDQNDR